MAEYHWNEQPADLLALLDNSASLPPLDGFESSAFGASAPLPDFFSSLETTPTLDDHNTQAIFQDLQVPDLSNTKYEDAPAPTPTSHLVETNNTVPHVANNPVPTAHSDVGSTEGELNSEGDFSRAPPHSPDASNSLETLPAGSASLSSAASDVTVGMSAVELAKKQAEDFANGKVSERKRKMNRDDGDGKRRKGNDGEQCSDGEDDAPEKVSHRKYQKRLQKNRDSAYVSRIRRREYTKRLEEGLNRVEKEKNELQSRYDALHRRFEVVVQELKTFKEATHARLSSMSKALAVPVGAARQAPKPKNAGALVTTMFMCALIFGFMVPESLTARSPFAASAIGGTQSLEHMSEKMFNVPMAGSREEKGKVWRSMGLSGPPPEHWKGLGNDLFKTLSSNVTELFGGENGSQLVDLMKTRFGSGVLSEDTIKELSTKAQHMVDNIDREEVKRTLPSRRSVLFRKVLRKLATLADECFTKELVALLTIRLLPTDMLAVKK